MNLHELNEKNNELIKQVTDIDQVVSKLKPPLSEDDRARYKFMADRISHSPNHESMLQVMYYFIKEWTRVLPKS